MRCRGTLSPPWFLWPCAGRQNAAAAFSHLAIVSLLIPPHCTPPSLNSRHTHAARRQRVKPVSFSCSFSRSDASPETAADCRFCPALTGKVASLVWGGKTKMLSFYFQLLHVEHFQLASPSLSLAPLTRNLALRDLHFWPVFFCFSCSPPHLFYCLILAIDAYVSLGSCSTILAWSLC